jgi:PKD repeat protein
MKRRKAYLIIFLLLFLTTVTGCKGLIPSEFKIETTSELGPDTLDRIDDINDTLATGMEIGPETRATIEELNKTIDEGLEFGFTESTLQRVDVLLAMVEQGVGIKAGLDAETNRTVNNLIEILDDQPGQWEDTMTAIITTLEGSTSRVAEQMADEVQGLMVEARINTQQLSASMGAEFRCNVDFMSTRAGDTLDQFIGRSLVGRLREIVTGEEMEEEEEEIPTPMVCQMVPDQISLEKVGDEFVFETAVVRISGYNFVEENKPHAYVVDEAGTPVEAVELYPFLSSPYQIQLNLQDIDFSAVPTRSRVVFEWPPAGSFFALAMVLPSDEPTPTVEVKPELTINVDDLLVRVGPGEDYFPFPAKAVRGATYEVTGHNGNQTWWQIDFEGDPSWVPDSAVTRNSEPVGPASSIPLDPPQAAFSMSSTEGQAPHEIYFYDESTGDPTGREWEVIPEEGGKVFLEGSEEVSHKFTYGGTFDIRLHVWNDWGEDEVVKQVDIEGAEFVMPLFQFKTEIHLFSTATPSYSGRPFIFKNFVGVAERTPINTGIPTEDYACAIVSLAAHDGKIGLMGASYSDHILTAFLNHYGLYWEVYLDFTTLPAGFVGGDPETWSVGVMCVDRNSSSFIENIEFTPTESNQTVDLSDYAEIPDNFTCMIAGYDLQNGNIENEQKGDILKAFTRKVGDEWIITADFMDKGDQEEWELQVLCFYDNPSVILRKEIPNLSARYEPTTGISSNQYACGVSGMEIENARIEIMEEGSIIRAFTYHYGGDWKVYVDFLTKGSELERWNVELLCVKRSVANIDMNRWGPGWVNP